MKRIRTIFLVAVIAVCSWQGCQSEQKSFVQRLRDWAGNVKREKGHAASISFRLHGQRITISTTRQEPRVGGEGGSCSVGDPLPFGFYVYPTNRIYPNIDAIIMLFDVESIDRNNESLR